jgi:hypothetical protein
MDIKPVDAPQVAADFHLKLRKRFMTEFVKQCSGNEHF